MKIKVKDRRIPKKFNRINLPLIQTPYKDCLGKKISVGDILVRNIKIENGDGTISNGIEKLVCMFGNYELEGFMLYGVYFMNTETQKIYKLDSYNKLSKFNFKIIDNDYISYKDYWCKSVYEFVRDAFSEGMVISDKALNIYMLNEGIDLTLNEVKHLLTTDNKYKCAEVYYKLDENMFPEYSCMKWKNKKDIPKEILEVDGECREIYERELSDNYIKKLLIRV